MFIFFSNSLYIVSVAYKEINLRYCIVSINSNSVQKGYKIRQRSGSFIIILGNSSLSGELCLLLCVFDYKTN